MVKIRFRDNVLFSITNGTVLAMLIITVFLIYLGFLTVLCPAYRLRPHWMMMWTGYFTYLFLRIKSREKLEMWQVAAHLYIFCYYGSLTMSASVQNYGLRMLILGTSVVLVFSFMALDRISS